MNRFKSDELFQRSRLVVPGGVHSPVRSFKGMGCPPVFFESAQGAELISVEGKRYIDYCMSFGPLILGHRDPEVQEAVLEMIHKAWTFGACERYSLELAEWIQAEIPFVERLRFVSSGTEAVMSALRLARAATGRQKILKFEGCYHGHVDSLLVKSGSGLAGESSSSSAGVSENVASETLVAPLDDEAALQQLFKERGHELAAVIIEPLPANFGLLIQRTEFLQALVQLAKENGCLVILDEVISGFRVAKGGMAELLGVRPDLVCYGKIIGGGFPVGCYGGRKEIMDLVAPLGPVYQAGTLSANPVGMRAGLATLKKVEKMDGWHALSRSGDLLVKGLRSVLQKKNTDLDVTGFGSLFWIHRRSKEPIRSVQQIPKGQDDAFRPLFLKALDRGLYLAPNAYEVGFVSLAHTSEVIQQTIDIIGESVG